MGTIKRNPGNSETDSDCAQSAYEKENRNERRGYS
jgi:hypothetical protein